MKAVVVLIFLLALSAACGVTEISTPTTPPRGMASPTDTPVPTAASTACSNSATHAPTPTPTALGDITNLDPRAANLVLQVGAGHVKLSDEKITFGFGVINPDYSFLGPLHSPHKTIFYDLKVFTEDGTLFWWLSKYSSAEISLDELKVNEMSHRYFGHEWDMRSNCPFGAIEGCPSGVCPGELIKAGLYRVVGSVGYYPDPDNASSRVIVESIPRVFYIPPTPDLLADVLKVQVEVRHDVWKEGSISYPTARRPYQPAPYPTPSSGDPAITFTIRIKNTSNSHLQLTLLGELYDVKVVSEDGTVFWWLSRSRIVVGRFNGTTFSPGEEKSYEQQWDLRSNCPFGTIDERFFFDCPKVLAKSGMHMAIGLAGYYPDPNGDPGYQDSIESEPVTFEIAP